MPQLSRVDLDACRAILARGSKSFALAALLLPRRVREPAAVFYAFCRVADDLIDASDAPERGLAALARRVDDIFRAQPADEPIDRALASVVAAHGLSRAPFDGLLEGFAWDCSGRQYETFDDLLGYAVRVAGTVGVTMTELMGPRAPAVLARACDLGVAMQLTNIARDVGTDARAGRVYLPREWLRRYRVGPAELTSSPGPGLRCLVEQLLCEADLLYRRADRGVPMLPRDCRVAIRAARLIYSGIHRAIERTDYDTVSSRAWLGTSSKLWRIAAAAGSALSPTTAPSVHEPAALPQARFLIEAAV